MNIQNCSNFYEFNLQLLPESFPLNTGPQFSSFLIHLKPETENDAHFKTTVKRTVFSIKRFTSRHCILGI